MEATFALKVMIQKIKFTPDFWNNRDIEIKNPAFAIKFLNFPTFMIIGICE